MTPYPLCVACDMPVMPGQLWVSVMRAGPRGGGDEAPLNPDEAPLVMHAGRCPAQVVDA